MKTTILLPLAALLFPLALAAQNKGDAAPKADKVDFAKQIWPILEKNCIECHSTAQTGADGKVKKPKGGVVLDNKDSILSAKKGKLIVPKNTGDSLLYHAITLPADDEDRMPPLKKGDPLKKDQQELIQKWIEQGGEFGTWTGKKDDKAGKPKDGEKPKDGDKPKEGDGKKGKGGTTGKESKEDAELAALAAGLQPVPADQLRALASLATIEPAAHDSPLLCVSFFGHEDEVDDRVVTSLVPLQAHIMDLNLGRTRITDAACATIAAMKHLRQLDLHATAIGDAGVARLAACTELRSLNLYDTKVADPGVAALAHLPKLAAVYLWQTGASPAAVARLRETQPAAQIVMAAELPAPMPPEQQGGQRRRK